MFQGIDEYISKIVGERFISILQCEVVGTEDVAYLLLVEKNGSVEIEKPYLQLDEALTAFDKFN